MRLLFATLQLDSDRCKVVLRGQRHCYLKKIATQQEIDNSLPVHSRGNAHPEARVCLDCCCCVYASHSFVPVARLTTSLNFQLLHTSCVSTAHRICQTHSSDLHLHKPRLCMLLCRGYSLAVDGAAVAWRKQCPNHHQSQFVTHPVLHLQVHKDWQLSS